MAWISGHCPGLSEPRFLSGDKPGVACPSNSDGHPPTSSRFRKLHGMTAALSPTCQALALPILLIVNSSQVPKKAGPKRNPALLRPGVALRSTRIGFEAALGFACPVIPYIAALSVRERTPAAFTRLPSSSRRHTNPPRRRPCPGRVGRDATHRNRPG